MAIEFIPIVQHFKIGHREIQFSALPVGLLRTKYIPLAARLANGEGAEPSTLEQVTEIVWRSISLVTPGVSLDEVESGLTLGEVVEIFAALGELSMNPRPKEELAKP